MKHAESKLAYKDVVSFALAMARGLSHLYLFGIIHRDVKMENMHFDGEGTLKIAGFGVVRIKADPKEMTGKTGSAPMYMAPEVLKGKSYNYKCDV
uniref:Protein kinase domain-containing protein n=1 Tax=Leersia perrieri TaxID=77586 RepID=A0A0D9WDY7_9ORYZ